jgi:hypothetical protein
VFTTLRPASREMASRPPVLWVLERCDRRSEELFTVGSPHDSQTLPVFSFREEAELYLGLGGISERGWQVSATRAPELAALLLGPYSHVQRVALDPLPDGVGAEALNALASMSRTVFADLLLSRASVRGL